VGESVLTAPPDRLAAIAAAVGTPLYVYDATVIRAQYRALTDALASVPHRIHYSAKANANLAVLGVLRELGAGADIVSVGELHRCRRAGIPASDIVFSGVGKRPDELDEALVAGVMQINVESFAELRLLATLARDRGRRAAVGIRVNPDVTTTTHPYTQTGQRDMKFGTPLSDVEPMACWIQDHADVELVSVGMHIGSQIADASRYRVGAERLCELVETLRAMGIETLRNVDVGGGLGIRYRDEQPLDPADFADAVQPLYEATALPIVVEPGRYVLGNAGALVTTCLYRKQAGGKVFVVVDAGMNDLLRPSLYRAAHEVQVLVPGTPDPAVSDGGSVDVVGPLCESGDFLALERDLPGAHPGAVLAVLGAGAYGFVMSSHYNGRPRAAEVLLDGERWAVVRRRETVEDLMRGEPRLGDLQSWETIE
jgi:diaminopimelate decarboxylase